MSEPMEIPAADGYPLGGRVWRGENPHSPVVVVNGATAVRSRFYEPFAQALQALGCDVVTYDYRGIGNSRPASLRGFPAGWMDWGSDFEGVLLHARRTFPEKPIHVVGHSVGGMVIGLARSATIVSRILLVGAQFAYWGDYARDSRLSMYARWHVVMPMLARVCGYVPAKRLGWMEDTPKGVALDWASMGSRLEDSLVRRNGLAWGEGDVIRSRFGQVRAPILAVGPDDDPFGTVAAVDRLLDYYSGSATVHMRISAAAGGDAPLGHFGFFQPRRRESLWPLAFDWLLRGDLREQVGVVAAPRSARASLSLG